MGVQDLTPKLYKTKDLTLAYYEFQNVFPTLVMLHAQGVDSSSFFGVAKKLSNLHF